ncbi:sulfotransferase family protein [Frigidibacter oleivorans]|uniref:sulfotransferase family protein n=1 Tax=Frigidibacter oleivorans TaxID=2487129 RepID=UPI000F8E3851|nr:sulfotransferase [Frigidibacter oleivorans]
MARMLMLLSPPRSFSSLVSTMIGQHPEIYGFPELHIMMRDTVGEALKWERNCERFLGPPGLLRTLAELVYGGQTAENVLEAANFLEDNANTRSEDIINLVMDRATEVTGAKYCLEKSPSVTFLPPAMERIRRAWPDAMYIHVTRHPVNLKKSMDEYIRELTRLSDVEKDVRLRNSMTMWPVTQRNILDFCSTLAPGQYLRIRGEDVLSDASNVMRQVAEWLGLRTDDAAIAAMLRPEESPYAVLGPVNAAFGNDPKFIDSPKFRPGKPRLGRLDDFFATEDGTRLDAPRQAYLRQLANCLGYQ